MSYTKQLKIVFDENNIVADIKAFKRFEFVVYALYTVL